MYIIQLGQMEGRDVDYGIAFLKINFGFNRIISLFSFLFLPPAPSLPSSQIDSPLFLDYYCYI